MRLKTTKEIKPVAIMQSHTVLMSCMMGFFAMLVDADVRLTPSLPIFSDPRKRSSAPVVGD